MENRLLHINVKNKGVGSVIVYILGASLLKLRENQPLYVVWPIEGMAISHIFVAIRSPCPVSYARH